MLKLENAMGAADRQLQRLRRKKDSDATQASIRYYEKLLSQLDAEHAQLKTRKKAA